MLGLPSTHSEIIALADGEYAHTDIIGITLRVSEDRLDWYRDGEFLARYDQVSYFKLPHFLERWRRSSTAVALTAPTLVEASQQHLISQIPPEELEFDEYGMKMADIADQLLSQSQTILRAHKGIEAQDIIHKDVELAVKLLDHAYKNYRRRKNRF